MRQFIEFRLSLGRNGCTLIDYTINGLRSQLLNVLQQLESGDNDEYEIVIEPVLTTGCIVRTYRGDNRTETIRLIKQLLE